MAGIRDHPIVWFIYHFVRIVIVSFADPVFLCGLLPASIILKKIIGLAFAASIGITFLVLGCALPQFNNWWPMFVLLFYALSPVPRFIAVRYHENVESSSALIEVCTFITACIVVSAFGLPIVLAHSNNIIQWGACGLVLAGNTVVFCTILAYYIVFTSDEFDYSSW